MAFVLMCNAQERTAKIIEVLRDGSYVVEIQGSEFRALPAEKIVEIAKRKIELETCKENEARRIQQLEIADRDVIIAQQQRDIEHASFVHAMQIYTAERELRQGSMQFLPHSGKSNWLLTALDSPYSQAFWKMALPAFTAWRSTKR